MMNDREHRYNRLRFAQANDNDRTTNTSCMASGYHGLLPKRGTFERTRMQLETIDQYLGCLQARSISHTAAFMIDAGVHHEISALGKRYGAILDCVEDIASAFAEDGACGFINRRRAILIMAWPNTARSATEAAQQLLGSLQLNLAAIHEFPMIAIGVTVTTVRLTAAATLLSDATHAAKHAMLSASHLYLLEHPTITVTDGSPARGRQISG